MDLHLQPLSGQLASNGGLQLYSVRLHVPTPSIDPDSRRLQRRVLTSITTLAFSE